MAKESKPKVGLGEHLNASQLRLDTWHQLKHQSVSLLERVQQGRAHTGLVENIQLSMQKLASIEKYWAFPGNARFLRNSSRHGIAGRTTG